MCVRERERERKKERKKEKEREKEKGEGDFYCVGFSPHHSSGSNTEMLQYMKLFLSLSVQTATTKEHRLGSL